MNDEIVIRALGLRKSYRLYTRSRYRVLDALGLLSKNKGRYKEHLAIDGIDLNIYRGEKVGIIGRNGAGKSTLLKLITGVSKPTAGELHVNGRIHALLELGSGFHPDFTGRENVYGFLSHMGLSPEEIAACLDEAVEFAEVQEFIDQPIRNFSTGMVSRLMFAASTVIEPELLVIDEILSVGDAYFANKSFRRIRQLCNEQGGTLLLVTHDIQKAATLCDRFIWINDGVIRMDDKPDIVANHYSLAIRDQEEKRLRQLTVNRFAMADNADTKNGQEKLNTVFGRLRRKDGMPVNKTLSVSNIQFYNKDQLLVSISSSENSDKSAVILDPTFGNWSDVRSIDDRKSRSLLRYGSIYHQAPFVINDKRLKEALSDPEADIFCRIEFFDNHQEAFDVDLFVNPRSDRRFRASFQSMGTGGWSSDKARMTLTSKIDAVDGSIRFGSQLLSLQNVQFFDETGSETNIFNVGGKLEVRMKYTIAKAVADISPVIQLGFQKNGVHVVRMILSGVKFNAADRREGEIRASFDPLRLGPGEYVINVVAMGEGGYDDANRAHYFTVNPLLLDHHLRGYHISVSQTGNMLIDGLSFIHPARWTVDSVDVHGEEGIK